MTGLIYKITSPSGRIYIGQSTNYKRRLKAYKTMLAKGQPKLHNSFLKYGIKSHIFEVIEKDIDIIILGQREEIYIKLFNCVEDGLNCTYNSVAFMRGRKHTEETKLKMSIKRKGKLHGPPTESHKINLSKSIQNTFINGRRSARLGVKLLDSTKQKLRESHLGKKFSKEHIKKLSDVGKLRKHSKETIKKMSINSGRRKISDEKIKCIKEALLDKYLPREIASTFQVSMSAVYDIRDNKRGYLNSLE